MTTTADSTPRSDVASAAPDVLIRRSGGVLRLTLNRPEAANALLPSMRNALIDQLAAASADTDIRVVVIAAEGRHFCSGADLRAAGPVDGPGDVARAIREGAQRLVAAVLDCEKPVVAEVGGAAAGIGAHLAFACDFVVASEDARFIEVFVRRGLVPDGGGAYLLPRLVGVARAKRLLMLGDDVSAAAARDIGLIGEVVPRAELADHVNALAGRLAESPTHALGAIKWLVNSSLESSRAQAFADEALVQERNMGTADAAEGMASFGERRPARFTGR